MKSANLLLLIFLLSGHGIFALTDNGDTISGAGKINEYRELSIENMRKDTRKAIDYAGKALELAREHNDLREEAIALNLLGYGHDFIGDYPQALNYYNQSLEIREKLGDRKMIANTINNLGTIHLKMKQETAGLQFYKRALKIRREINDLYGISQTLNNIGIYYLRKNNPDKAMGYYLESLEVKRSLNDPELLASAYNNIGHLNSQMGKYGAALEFFRNALIYRSEAGDVFGTALTHFNIADVNWQLRNFDTALYSLQYALIALIPNFEDTSVLINPHPQLIFPETIILEILDLKGLLFFERFKFQSKNINDLKHSLKTYKLLSKLYDKIRTEYTSDESKLLLAGKGSIVYKTAAEVAYLLYKKTNDNEFLNLIFGFSEKSKASVLHEQIRENEARHYAGIPDTIIRFENDLKVKLMELTRKVHKNDEDGDSLKSELIATKQQLYSLVRMLESNFPDYYDLKYDYSVVKIPVIQDRMEPDDVLLEYFHTDTSLFAFCITPDSVILHRQAGLNSLDSMTVLFRNVLVRGPDAGNPDTLRETGQSLYRMLIAPFETCKAEKNLVVIPDGKLLMIPFGALIVQISSAEPTYLIAQNSISYAYSSSLLFRKANRPRQFRKVRSVAVAPVFDGNIDTVAAHILRDSAFSELSGSLNEVGHVMKHFDGKTLLNKDATESGFKENMGGHDILHIATHGAIDHEEPLFSRLVFYQEPGSSEDGFLHTYELFNLQSEAQLAVLSACNSGYGNLRSGEGLITLARGFLYAGIQTLLISQWKVNDETTVRLMDGFYSNLREGDAPAGALRKAKLSYLENADRYLAHPAFWAGFIVIGENESVVREHFSTLLTIIPLLMLIFIGVAVFKSHT